MIALMESPTHTATRTPTSTPSPTGVWYSATPTNTAIGTPPALVFYCDPSNRNATDDVSVNWRQETPAKNLQYLYDALWSVARDVTVYATGSHVSLASGKPFPHIVGNFDYDETKLCVARSINPDTNGVTTVYANGWYSGQSDGLSNVIITGHFGSPYTPNPERCMFINGSYSTVYANDLIFYQCSPGILLSVSESINIDRCTFSGCGPAVRLLENDSIGRMKDCIMRNCQPTLHCYNGVADFDATWNDWGVYTETEIADTIVYQLLKKATTNQNTITFVPFYTEPLIPPLAVPNWSTY